MLSPHEPGDEGVRFPPYHHRGVLLSPHGEGVNVKTGSQWCAEAAMLFKFHFNTTVGVIVVIPYLNC